MFLKFAVPCLAALASLSGQAQVKVSPHVISLISQETLARQDKLLARINQAVAECQKASGSRMVLIAQATQSELKCRTTKMKGQVYPNTLSEGRIQKVDLSAGATELTVTFTNHHMVRTRLGPQAPQVISEEPGNVVFIKRGS